MKALIITAIILAVFGLIVLITIGLANLFIWFGAPKWIAWMVAIGLMIIGTKVSNNK